MPSAYQLRGRTQYSWTDTTALDNLVLDNNVPKPTSIPAGHALIRIRAAALNARDNMVIAHDPLYPGPHVENLVPCADGAGEIESVGENSRFKIGDKVIINPNAWQDWSFDGSKGEMMGYVDCKTLGAGQTHGTLTEYAVIEEDRLVLAPKHLTFEEMAALPAAGGTAMHALFFGPRAIRAGQTVLAQGTGGVSCFVIQLAAAVGATVIVTSSSDEKLQETRAMGATYLINYRTHPNWSEEVLKITEGKGVDLVVEIAGSSTIEQSLASAKHGGLVALVGFLSENKLTDLITSIIYGGKTVYGCFMFTRTMNEALVKLIEEKAVRPKIGKVFEWGDAKKAFIELGKQSSVGKVVIKVG